MMRTPDGRECPYYYANFHRREVGVEVCRLLEETPDGEIWTSDYCATCPVPDIRRANACENMVLHARIGRRWFWQPKRVLIKAICTLTGKPVADPYVGCGRCHPLPTFVVADPDTKANKETKGMEEN